MLELLSPGKSLEATTAPAIDEGERPAPRQEALIDDVIRSYKIEGCYKDLGYVMNTTAYYRLLRDESLSAPYLT